MLWHSAGLTKCKGADGGWERAGSPGHSLHGDFCPLSWGGRWHSLSPGPQQLQQVPPFGSRSRSGPSWCQPVSAAGRGLERLRLVQQAALWGISGLG